MLQQEKHNIATVVLYKVKITTSAIYNWTMMMMIEELQPLPCSHACMDDKGYLAIGMLICCMRAYTRDYIRRFRIQWRS